MSRRGVIHEGLTLVLGSLVVLVVSVALLIVRTAPRGDGSNAAVLRLYCAAGIKPAVEPAVRAYEAETGVRLEIQYGGSGTLLSQLEVRPDGVDLYLAADDSYLIDARERGLVREILPLARMHPVLAVAKGNPKAIGSVAALLARDDATIGLANPDAAAIGKITRRALTEHGVWDAIAARCKVFKPTVNDIANDVRLGAVDATVIWDATVAQNADALDAVPDPLFASYERGVAVGVTASTTRPAAALRFARYLAARDRGRAHFERAGFDVVSGDPWTARPKLVLYAGSMFNQAIDDTITAFERREGVEVTRTYQGCGLLVSQMRAGALPDAYFACDETFLDRVSDLFEDAHDVAENALVLVTSPAASGSVRDLDDLLQDDLRVGVAHREKSALGHLTFDLLDAAGLTERYLASGNHRQDAPQGDFLVNALRAGALDAAIVYKSNAAPYDGRDLVIVRELPVIARQPYAVGVGSTHQQTMNRLREAMMSPESRERFEALGFRWVGGGA